MRYVWRFLASRAAAQPFLGAHVVDTTTMRPYCSDQGDLLQAAASPDGFVLVCVKCLEYAEWRMNHG